MRVFFKRNQTFIRYWDCIVRCNFFCLSYHECFKHKLYPQCAQREQSCAQFVRCLNLTDKHYRVWARFGINNSRKLLFSVDKRVETNNNNRAKWCWSWDKTSPWTDCYLYTFLQKCVSKPFCSSCAHVTWGLQQQMTWRSKSHDCQATKTLKR